MLANHFLLGPAARIFALAALLAGVSACRATLHSKASSALSRGDAAQALADHREAEKQGEGDRSALTRTTERLVDQRLAEAARLEQQGNLQDAFAIAWGTRDAGWRDGRRDPEVKAAAARLLAPFIRSEIAKAEALPGDEAIGKLRELLLLANDDRGAGYDVRAAIAVRLDREWPQLASEVQAGRVDAALERAERLTSLFPAGAPQQQRLEALKSSEAIKNQAAGVQLQIRGLAGAALVRYRLADRASPLPADTLAQALKRANYYIRATGAKGPCGQLSDRVVSGLSLSPEGAAGVEVEIDLATCEPTPTENRRNVKLDDGSTGELTTATASVTLEGVARFANPDGSVALRLPIASTQSKTQEGIGAPPNAAEALIEDAADEAAKAIANQLNAAFIRLRAAAADDYAKRGEKARTAGQLDAADHFFALATRVQGSAPAAAQAHFRERYGWSDPSSRLASTPGPAGALGSVSLGYRPRVLTLPDPDRIEVVETGLPHFAIRGGWGGHTGIVGAGLEVHPWGKHFGLAVGTGTYLVTGGFAFTFAETFARSGVYLDLHGALVRPGLVGPKVGSGVGGGATLGYDFRPEPWLSIKTGLGVGKNTASQPSDQARLLIFDLNLGVVF